MTLKRWAIPNFPLKSLVDGENNLWTASANGTDEYYFNGDLFQHTPNAVHIDGMPVTISVNALGSLAAGEWGWGDNDELGKDTVYVRLSDGADPDTQESGYLQCSEPVMLLEAQAEKETIFLSFLVANYSDADNANIRIMHKDSQGDIIFRWILDIPATNSPVALDSKIVLEPGDKIFVMSDVPEVAVLASGDES